MPLDDFPASILRTLSQTRTPDNTPALVADPELGYRLSFIDLAVNKVLAAASRRQPRDLLDLRFVGHTTLPLWNALNAIPGKDAALGPLAAINMIRRYSQYAPGEIENSVIMPEGFDVPTFVGKVRQSLDLAERQLRHVPVDLAGKILLGAGGRSLCDPIELAQRTTWRAVSPQRGRHWPTGPDLDALLIDRMIRHFGRHGTKLWDYPKVQAATSAKSDLSR